MSHNILLTGASGYLGGTLLARWKEANLPAYSKLFALTRTDVQAEAVKKLGAEPLEIDLSDPQAIHATIIDNSITIIYYLIDYRGSNTTQFIKALSQVKKQTGRDTHFLFTTGAKVFSSHAGAPTDKPLLDTDSSLYDIQKNQKPKFDIFNEAIGANNTVIEQSEKYGVKSYIFAPCIVYGRGLGFGNPISIQTVAIVKAALKTRSVNKVNEGRPTWPVCHVLDNTGLYIEILRGILQGRDIGSGQNGYFLAASGSVAWDDIYGAFAKALKKEGKIDGEDVGIASETTLAKMGEALGVPKELVDVQLGGLCTFTAKHGKQIGWNPEFEPKHILDTADEEVKLILANLSA